jgi:organic radical activating enzyme
MIKYSKGQQVLTLIEKIVKKIVAAFGLGNSKTALFLGGMKSKLNKKYIRKTTLDSIDIHMAEHCNLGCYSCNHFSPLADEEYADLETTTKDLKRLSELTDGNIRTIYLVGGEPLLHLDIISFMKVSRELFPKSKVQIITNGLLLLKQSANFWDACNKYNIIMTPTKYPGINWEKIEQRAKENNYKFSYFDFSGNTQKVSRKFVLDLTGAQDMKKSYANCCIANCSIGLFNGRLATCSFVFTMRHFNKYFNQNVLVTDKDSIDIYKAKNIQEILDFLASPIPLCRYCKSIGDKIAGQWMQTKKDISEWT